MLLLLICAWHVLPAALRERLRGLRRIVGETYTVHTKLKLLIGYYQILTRLDDVYVLVLPGAVRDLLSAFRLAVSFGLKSLPLACIGARGYLARQHFWMLAPGALNAAAHGVSASRGWLVCSQSNLAPLQTGRLLPIALRVLFVAYLPSWLETKCPLARLASRGRASLT
jgi:hypothetical protein